MSYENLDYPNTATNVLFHGASKDERRRWLEAGVDPELTSRAAFHADSAATAEAVQTQADQPFNVTEALQRALEQRG